MSKKTLLNETQIRQFMKLASLEPLTGGFVKNLSETHGRGMNDGPQYAGRVRVMEEEDLEADPMSPDMGVDMEEPPMEELPMEEPPMEEPEASPEEEQVGDQMISVSDLLTAITAAIEKITGEETSGEIVDDEEAPEADTDVEMDMDMEEEPADDTAEDPAEEILENTDEEITEDTNDDLVEQITKRVAARILKSALTKR